MAGRKRKVISAAENLKNIEAQIVETEALLKKLKAQKKELMEQKKQEDMQTIYEMISASGKSLEEVKELLAGS